MIVRPEENMGMTHEQIAVILSKEDGKPRSAHYVRTIEARAMRKLRAYLRFNPKIAVALRAYLDGDFSTVPKGAVRDFRSQLFMDGVDDCEEGSETERTETVGLWDTEKMEFAAERRWEDAS